MFFRVVKESLHEDGLDFWFHMMHVLTSNDAADHVLFDFFFHTQQTRVFGRFHHETLLKAVKMSRLEKFDMRPDSKIA